ncbi:hypothetical protein [Actinophytocola sp. NPDC049390]
MATSAEETDAREMTDIDEVPDTATMSTGTRPDDFAAASWTCLR